MNAESNEKADANPSDDEITLEELAYWAEFCSWTTLALTPLLRWVNGPAVSTDQLVVRIALVVIAACVAVSLRVMKLARRRHSGKNAS